jgi:DNA-binding NarL/FixJ family response regulator
MAKTPPEAFVRVALAHDQPIVAAGVRALLVRRGACVVVGEALSADDTMDLVRRERPDVLIVNHRPRVNGVDIARRLKLVESNTRLILLVSQIPDDQKQKALRYGAWGVLSKATAAEVLADCVGQAMQGQRWSGDAGVAAPSAPTPRSPGTRSRSLSFRENEIVELVATGASNKEIASRLRLDEHAVKNNLRRIFKKLDVANRMGLAMLAIDQGLVKASRAGAAASAATVTITTGSHRSASSEALVSRSADTSVLPDRRL